jgi:hypothetical protein
MARMLPLPLRYTVDPNDPRAPSQELWDRFSEAERDRIIQMLPTAKDLLPGENTQHFTDKAQVFDTLRRHFDRINRRIFVASELQVYYPAQPTFTPDIFAVADVEFRRRSRWVVSREGRGLDFVLEILSESDRQKDLRRNVEWFPALGIPEYFVYDRDERQIHGFRLPRPGAAAYDRIAPRGSGYPSALLGLDLTLEGERLRFRYGLGPVPDADELITRLDATVDDLLARRDEAAARAAAEEKLHLEAVARAVTEEQLRVAAEARLAEALAELERLRRG